MLLADALRWINDRLTEFRSLPARYDAMYERARQVWEAEARYRAEYGDYTQSARELAALQAMVEIDEMRRQWQATVDKLVVEPVASGLGAAALPVGAIVVAIRAVSVVAVVWAITSLLRRATPMERVVEQLASMPGASVDDVLRAAQIAADEKSGIEEVVGGFSTALKWLVVGGIAWLMLPVIARKR